MKRVLVSMLTVYLLLATFAAHVQSSEPQLRFIFGKWWYERDLLAGEGKSMERYLKINERLLEQGHWAKDPQLFRREVTDFGSYYNYFGQYEKALKYYNMVSEFTLKMDDQWSQGIILANIATVYHAQGDYEKAMKLYSQALESSKKFEDLKVEGIISGNIAALHHMQGHYKDAAALYEKALGISKRVPGNQDQDTDIYGQGINLGNLAILYEDWGQYSKALEYYTKALHIKIRTGDISGQGTTLADMAKVYQDWGQNAKAKEYYEKALQKKITSGDKRGEGDVLMRMGNFCATTNQPDEAIALIQKGMATWQKLGISTKTPEGMIANLYLEKGEPEKAEPLVKKSSDESVQARLQVAKSDYKGAASHFHEMLDLAEKNRNVENLFTAYTGLGLACEAMGDTKKAAQHYNNAVQFTEELRSSLERDQRERFFDVKVNGFFRTDPYKGLARALLKTGQASEAFKMAEFTKARVFSEAISNRSGEQNSNVPAAIVKLDEEINNQVSALKTTRQKAYEREDKSLLASLEPQIKNLETKLKSHIEMLREKYPVFAATKYPEPMDLAQQALQENEWVITYDVSESGVLIFLLKGKQLVKSIFKPVPHNEIVELVEKFRRPLEMEPGKTLTEKLESFEFKSAKGLSDLLLGDLLTDLPKGVFVKIVPDECLGLLPFEALVLNDGGKVAFDGSRTQVSGADFFGDRNQISYCQSVTALTLARAASANRKTGDQLLVIADPVFAITDDRAQAATQTKVAEGEKEHYENLMTTIEDCAKGTFRFKRLPETTALADNLAKLYGSKAEKMTGLEASKSNFINTKAKEIEKYRWIVFATHGLFSKNIPGLTEPFLALTMIPAGTDGFLTMSDVMSLKMSADLVALTACQSGIGNELYGEGTMSMGRAFQYAGARSVLMSLWSVAEKSSVMLVESFFNNLNDHKSKSESLKLARDDVRKAGYDHPFFWAPFILVGEVN